MNEKKIRGSMILGSLFLGVLYGVYFFVLKLITTMTDHTKED